MESQHYLHYWAPERAEKAFDGVRQKVTRLRHMLYRTRRVGDVIWVATRVGAQFVIVLRAVVAKKPQLVRGFYEFELSEESRSLPRAMPLTLQKLRKLRFKNPTNMLGSLSQLLVGPLATIRPLDPGAVPILHGLWNASPAVEWEGTGNSRLSASHNRAPEKGGISPVTTRVLSAVQPEDDESAFPEGIARYRMHRTLERDPTLVTRVKRDRLKREGVLRCDVCDFDFKQTFGAIGAGYIEAHHTTPVASLDGASKTRAADIALVCSNCHRMLHRGEKLLTVQELKVRRSLR